MQTAKTVETGRMPRLIRVFAGCTCDCVGFAILAMHSHYCIIEFIKLIGGNRSDARQNLIFPQTSFFIFNNAGALVWIRSSV